MSIHNVTASERWNDYMSIINSTYDPIDFLMSYENIPYKKSNRMKVESNNKKYPKKKPLLDTLDS